MSAEIPRLKKCPFCGGSALITNHGSYDRGTSCLTIKCDGCEIQMSEGTTTDYGKGIYKEARKVLFDRWNKRYLKPE